jgi:hypothetical protein
MYALTIVSTMVQTKPLLEKFAARGSSYYLIFDKSILQEIFGWRKGEKLAIEYDANLKRIIISEAGGS